ncbi:MAG: PIN domain-containing protein [Microbacterium sp.]
MIVLDAGVLIAHLSGADAHTDRAFEILDTEEELSIHLLTLAEVLVHPARDDRETLVLDAIDRLGVIRLAPTQDEAVQIARLRAKTSLKMPDCCVLAAAERQGATLATFDRRLADVARSRGAAVVSWG